MKTRLHPLASACAVLMLILSLQSVSSYAAEAGGPLSDYQPVMNDTLVQMLRAGDPAKGESTFMRKGSSCHDHLQQGGHGKGPHLWNIFGRQAGTQSGFDYSEAMRTSGHAWDDASLNYHLTRADRAVPGRSMEFRGIRKDQQRADLLAFMATFNDVPPQLP